jgi:GT2 family glycosyltransferase
MVLGGPLMNEVFFISGCGEDTRRHRLLEQDSKKKDDILVDVIVCVHNALENVKECLNSLYAKKTIPFNLIIINDGSDEETTIYLENFAKQKDAILQHNKTAKGYTIAANMGLKKSSSKYVILLNSDTIVTSGWIEKMIECIEVDKKTGIVSPLSNAASWKTVPEMQENNDWKVNTLPNNINLELMSAIVKFSSLKEYPTVSFLNGFCFMIKREVINKIGIFDEETFPTGYGEENDYCIRALNTGFKLRIVDDCYILHEKAKSYAHETRKKLSKSASQLLRNKHGDEKVSKLINEIKTDSVLSRIRSRIKSVLDEFSFMNELINKKILFVLPVKGGGGGANSVVQEVQGLRRFGLEVCIANKKEYKEIFLEKYSEAKEFCIFYKNVNELIEKAKEFDCLVATVFHSVKVIERILKELPDKATAYYVQDYEPWFFPVGSVKYQEAVNSFNIIPQMKCFAKTDWICKKVEKNTCKKVFKVFPGIDNKIYNKYLNFNKSIDANQINITAMVRPSSPRRSPKETIKVLRNIKKIYKDKVNINIFGCSDEELKAYHNFLDFDFYNYGVLKREDVANLLKKSDIFIDMSTYQGFGRTGIEAMSLGCTTVLPKDCGTSEYAINNKNSILIDGGNIDEATKAVCRLIEDNKLRNKFIIEGFKTASKYTIERAVLSELLFFKKVFLGRYNKNKIGVLYTKMGGERPTGSSYNRIILPLQKLFVKTNVDWISMDYEHLFCCNYNVLIIQRNVIKDIYKAKRIVEFCRSENIKLVFEIDDLIFENNILDPYEKEAVIYLLKESHLVITSTKKLAEEIKCHNCNVKVIGNYIDKEVWLYNDKLTKKSSTIKFVFFGTPSHDKDINMIKNALEKINKKYDRKIEFHHIGLKIALGKKIDIDYDAYPNFVKSIIKNFDWDFAIAPLEDKIFDNCKSDLKFLEYSMLGLPGIYSNVIPYKESIINNKEGLIVNNDDQEWIDAIEKYINNCKMRDYCKKNALTKVLNKRLMDYGVNKWIDALLKGD